MSNVIVMMSPHGFNVLVNFSTVWNKLPVQVASYVSKLAPLILVDSIQLIDTIMYSMYSRCCPGLLETSTGMY